MQKDADYLWAYGVLPAVTVLQEVPRNLVTVFKRPALERRTINMVEAKPQKRSRDTNWFLGGQESFIPKQAMSTAGAAAGGSLRPAIR